MIIHHGIWKSFSNATVTMYILRRVDFLLNANFLLVFTPPAHRTFDNATTECDMYTTCFEFGIQVVRYLAIQWIV